VSAEPPAAGSKLDRIRAWLVASGLGDPDLDPLVEGSGSRLAAEGFGVARVRPSIAALHPTIGHVGTRPPRGEPVLPVDIALHEEAVIDGVASSTSNSSFSIRSRGDGAVQLRSLSRHRLAGVGTVREVFTFDALSSHPPLHSRTG
jgi:hypothetical protein